MNNKAIFLFVISIFIFNLSSCHQEKSDDFVEYAKADPIISGVENTTNLPNENEQENVNDQGITELTKSDSLSDASTAFAVNDQGKYSYKLHLEKGKIYPLHTKAVSTTTQKFRGKSATETSTTIEDVDFKVLQAQNGQFKMSATFVNSKMIVSGGGESVTVDASLPQPKNKLLLGGWMVQKARKGKTVTFQMDESGNISNVKGFEAIHQDLKKLLQTEVSGKELDELYKMVTSQLNGETFKIQVQQGLIQFPKNGAALQETWSEKNKGGGSLNFTLSKIEDGKAYINIQSNIPNQSDTQTKDGVTGTFSASMNTQGTVILDVSSGWISTGKLTDTMTQKESYTDGQQTESTSVTSKNTTTINQ